MVMVLGIIGMRNYGKYDFDRATNPSEYGGYDVDEGTYKKRIGKGIGLREDLYSWAYLSWLRKEYLQLQIRYFAWKEKKEEREEALRVAQENLDACLQAAENIEDDEPAEKAENDENIKFAKQMVSLAEKRIQLRIDPTELDPDPASQDGKWIEDFNNARTYASGRFHLLVMCQLFLIICLGLQTAQDNSLFV